MSQEPDAAQEELEALQQRIDAVRANIATKNTTLAETLQSHVQEARQRDDARAAELADLRDQVRATHDATTALLPHLDTQERAAIERHQARAAELTELHAQISEALNAATALTAHLDDQERAAIARGESHSGELADLRERLAGTRDAISGIGKSLSQQQTAAAEDAKEARVLLASSYTDLAGQIGNLSEFLGETARESTSRDHEHSAELGDLRERLTVAAEVYATLAKAIDTHRGEASKRDRELTEGLSEAHEQLGTQIGAFGTILDEINGRIDDASHGSHARDQEHSADLAALRSHIEGAGETLGALAEGVDAHAQAAIDRADQHTESLASLRGDVTELESAFEGGLNRALKQVHIVLRLIKDHRGEGNAAQMGLMQALADQSAMTRAAIDTVHETGRAALESSTTTRQHVEGLEHVVDSFVGAAVEQIAERLGFMDSTWAERHEADRLQAETDANMVKSVAQALAYARDRLGDQLTHADETATGRHRETSAALESLGDVQNGLVESAGRNQVTLEKIAATGELAWRQTTEQGHRIGKIAEAADTHHEQAHEHATHTADVLSTIRTLLEEDREQDQERHSQLRGALVECAQRDGAAAEALSVLSGDIGHVMALSTTTSKHVQHVGGDLKQAQELIREGLKDIATRADAHAEACLYRDTAHSQQVGTDMAETREHLTTLKDQLDYGLRKALREVVLLRSKALKEAAERSKAFEELGEAVRGEAAQVRENLDPVHGAIAAVLAQVQDAKGAAMALEDVITREVAVAREHLTNHLLAGEEKADRRHQESAERTADTGAQLRELHLAAHNHKVVLKSIEETSQATMAELPRQVRVIQETVGHVAERCEAMMTEIDEGMCAQFANAAARITESLSPLDAWFEGIAQRQEAHSQEQREASHHMLTVASQVADLGKTFEAHTEQAATIAQVGQVRGEVSALGDLLASTVENFETTMAQALSTMGVMRSEWSQEARVLVTGLEEMGRTFLEKAGESERARDQAVIELGRRIARLEGGTPALTGAP